MRNKNHGLSQFEQFRLGIDTAISLKDALYVMNKQCPSRFEQETVIKSIKHNLCVHLYNYENGRPSINQAVLQQYVTILHTLNARFGFNIYEEYKQERIVELSRNRQPDVGITYNLSNGTQLKEEHMAY